MKTRKLFAAAFAVLLAGSSAVGIGVAQERPKGAVAPGDQDAIRERAFAPARLKARRRELVKALGEGALVILAAGKENGSDFRGHRARRSFLYLTGISDPGCSALLDGERDVLFAPPRNKAAEIWTGPHVSAGSEAAARYGFDDARSIEGWKGAVRQAVEEGPKRIFLSGIDAKELREIVRVPESIPVESCEFAIGRLRQVKDEDEVALLQRAAEISCAAFLTAARAIEPGRFEFEVQGLFEGACRFHGAEDQGYPSIVGSGPNSCVLHYDKNRRRMKEGDLLCMDAAAECGGYSADVTRTFPVSGKFSPEQRRCYEAVLRAQEAGIAQCRVGKTVRDVSEAARAVLREEGLLQHLPHGISHWIGLDVHDAGDYATPFAPGMVLTVEPGVYVADKEIGIRIEDDILVTEAGPVNLSAYAPKTVEGVERLLARARAGSLEIAPLPEPTPVPPLRARKGKLY